MSVHPVMRQNFAGKPYPIFYNIWDPVILAAGTWLAAALASGQPDECQEKVSDWQSGPISESGLSWNLIFRPVSVPYFAPVLSNTHFGIEATGIALSNTQQRHSFYKETSSLYHGALWSIFIVNCTQTCCWYEVLCFNYMSLHYKAGIEFDGCCQYGGRLLHTLPITLQYNSANSTTLAAISECALPVLGTKASNYITLHLIHSNGMQQLKWMCKLWASMGITSKVSILHNISYQNVDLRCQYSATKLHFIPTELGK